MADPVFDPVAALNAPVDPNTLVPNKTTMDSGTGVWTMTLPPNTAVATFDPEKEGSFPAVKLIVDLKNNQPSTIGFVGDATTVAPNPVDSIGFTANFEIDVINDTGTTLQGLALNLIDVDPKLPLSLVPGVVEFGHTVNANYPFFTNTKPVTGETTTFFSPDGKMTTPTGPAASKIALTGAIAPGKGATVLTSIHNTELSVGLNNFVMTVTPT